MAWVDKPEQGSLRAIIQAHNRQAVLVRGIAWTGLHLQILNVQFSAAEERLAQARSEWKSDRGEAWVDDLKAGFPELRQNRIRKILELFNFYGVRANTLPLNFDGRIVDAIQTNVIFVNESRLCLAYITFDSVARLRRHYIWRPRLVRQSSPISSYQTKKHRGLIPPVQAEDPYLLCILVALAQKHLELRYERGEPEESVQVSLLALSEGRADHVYFYTAYLPLSFLNKFSEPSLYFECPPVSISYLPISLEKPDEFLCRLRGVLLETGAVGGESPDASTSLADT
ncbi:hypothetical protein NOR_04897 [Metarhizium rileyi]|uniref:Uncharacterized protein n=1 Tax=Metarhizium rileyi (strain RCEF 4871) TaxID=1649241 RepID=A0A167DRL2_METRR|nr:hypothetical protein NOR_04897 [Metarhizium rileyi RCEF 4871]TWU76996.1 hypothetical protein ED733_007509 [Metarhizium rileyi]